MEASECGQCSLQHVALYCGSLSLALQNTRHSELLKDHQTLVLLFEFISSLTPPPPPPHFQRVAGVSEQQ